VLKKKKTFESRPTVGYSISLYGTLFADTMFLFFLDSSGLELRSSCLLGRRSTTLAIFPATDIAFLTN
jgi:hypothetical protein